MTRPRTFTSTPFQIASPFLLVLIIAWWQIRFLCEVLTDLRKGRS